MEWVENSVRLSQAMALMETAAVDAAERNKQA